MHGQGKLEERNAGYWRIATTLNQEIPPAWVTHAARKRTKRAKAAAAAAAAAAREESAAKAQQPPPPPPPIMPWLPAVGRPLPPRGPFGDRVDRVFFFGDLNYRVDLSRVDLEMGVSVCRQEREQAAEEGKGGVRGEEKESRRRIGRRFRPGESEYTSGRSGRFLGAWLYSCYGLDSEATLFAIQNALCTAETTARFGMFRCRRANRPHYTLPTTLCKPQLSFSDASDAPFHFHLRVRRSCVRPFPSRGGSCAEGKTRVEALCIRFLRFLAAAAREKDCA